MWQEMDMTNYGMSKSKLVKVMYTSFH
uniref:Uncharacterized protein n=1 Tax=Rhizophora mucronata TaxID=61149 RepID=A0A2P2QE71_RHIMU